MTVFKWKIYNCSTIVYLQADSSPFNHNISSQKGHNERCLVSSIAEDGRHILYDVSYFLVLPLDTLLALLSLICNSLTMTAVLRTRSIQRPSSLCLCSLSMTDIMWAVFALYKNTQTFTSVDICPKEVSGPGEWFPYLTSTYATLGNLAVISFDRLLALSKPFWYRTRVNKVHAIKQILLVWLLSGILAGIAVAVDSFPSLTYVNQWSALLRYVVCILTTICCYPGMLIANRRHRATLAQYDGNMRAMLAREKKVANTVGLIFIVLCFTFLPALVAPIALLKAGYSHVDIIPLRLFYLIFVTLNGLLNPLLNYGRNEEVRRAVKIILRCQCLTRDEHRNHVEDKRQRRFYLNIFRVNNSVNNLPPS